MLTCQRKHFTVYPALDVLEGRSSVSPRAARAGDGRGRRPGRGGRAFRGRGRDAGSTSSISTAPSRASRSGPRRARRGAGGPGTGRRRLPHARAIDAALAAGAARVLVGTAALDPAFLAAAVGRFGDALVVAVDARDGLVTRRRLDARLGALRRGARAALRGGRDRAACSSRARAATERWRAPISSCSKRSSRSACRWSPPAGSPRLDDLRALRGSAARARSPAARSGSGGSASPTRSA